MPRDIREPLRVVIDTREQSPWAWPLSDVVCRFAGLSAGDYALESDTEPVRGRELLAVRFAVERKSLSDWAGTISTGWERFQREIERMAAFPARVVIVEGDFEQCCFLDDGTPPQHGHPMIEPAFVCRRVAELSMMGVSVLFAGRADYAAALAYRVFLRRWELEESK
jgi:hypothetical protein